MYLTHRPTQAADLPACLPLIRNGFAFEPDDLSALLELWRYLLANRMAESAVIEDHEQPHGRQIVGFGLSVFVKNDFVTEAENPLTPSLACHILARWRQGLVPILDAKQIRRANTNEGLNGLILHNGWRDQGKTDEEIAAVRHKIMEAFYAHHCGYRLRGFLHEIYGEVEREKLMAQGWRLVSRKVAALPPSTSPNQQPYLVKILREDALDNPYSHFYTLFNPPQARYGFRATEQDVLQLALAGETDEEMAETLCLSIWTIKKRWQAIYDRVERDDSELLTTRNNGNHTPKHGEQRRRRLMNYLRLHPEELRPVTQSRREGSRG